MIKLSKVFLGHKMVERLFGNCRLKHFQADRSHITYSCDEVRKKRKELKSNFRKENFTDQIIKNGGRDRMYEQYCDTLDNFLKQCKCDRKVAILGIHCGK